MEHLRLEIFDLGGSGGSKYAYLPEDVSITITDTSEIFASGDVWSYSFQLNAAANAHIFGSAAELHGSRLHEQIHRRKARLWVEGIPMFLGYLTLGTEAEADGQGNIDVGFESGQKTFEDMIDGAKANQVPMIGDVQIGMALWRKRWTRFRVKLLASVQGSSIDPGSVIRNFTFRGPVTHDGGEEWFEFSYDGQSQDNSSQQYPRMVFPDGAFADAAGIAPAEDGDHVNTDFPYTEDEDGTPTHPYCNVALCYQRYGYKKKNPDGTVFDDYSSEPEAQRGYEVMPARRVNAAPSFFVLYWIRALMKHLGIHIEENQMMGVEDLRRLFFVNTACHYEEPTDLTGKNLERYGRYVSSNPDGRIIPEMVDPRRTVRPEESGFVGKDVVITSHDLPDVDLSEKVSVAISEIEEWSEEDKQAYISHNSYFHKAFATSECFPDADIKEVIAAIEAGFGVRLLFSDDYKRVRIVLLRNVFRSPEVQDIACDIAGEPSKTESAVRGFRITYGAGTEDTHFYYKGFADKLPHIKPYFADNSDKHDYSHWNLDADYGSLIHKVSAFDKTCYVTKNNGDAYGIKVDKDAKRFDELHPSLFEYAGFMDAEDGDCTGEEDTIETVSVGFKPAIMNDVNFEKERNEGATDQRFALFVGETMRPRRPDLMDGRDYDDPETVYSIDRLYADDSPAAGMKADDGIVKPGEFAVASDMYASRDDVSARLEYNVGYIIHIDAKFNIDGHINEGCRLYLQDNFEPNDTGVSPVETHDWGLTLGIMRGSGSDAYVDYKADPDDGEGNDTWDIVPGSSVTSHPDTCDSYGNEWDYNGAGGTSDVVKTPEQAASELIRQFPSSNAPFNTSDGYINGASVVGPMPDDTGQMHTYLVVTHRGSQSVYFGDGYIHSWVGRSKAWVLAMDAAGRKVIVETDGSYERAGTLTELCRRAYDPAYRPGSGMIIDNGVGSRYGRFSLKLRAEKPNPRFDTSKTEEEQQEPRYLEITNQNLRRRGLADEFYREYSHWVRNARTAEFTVRMELAELLAIDKTKKVRIGDVTGYVRKMQYTVGKQTGLGLVTIQVMYL